ncbi:unnamed protein product [Vitrella brassicaformis CCMP3155]|uniref:Uncharacterized protein n=1 Tax=Vitrella brassicaformis (strain CCMP3155) TaxID=1169540 RepID=A0A0G4EBP5_VITBC|nr:unnamed protein product [Vitrella brassicaformis CCMP3155]|eukprot:CEL93398.1 unnamed protein product [Vitrella brassicaformis CCMP3155]
MSESHGIGMPSAATADGDGGDAGDVDEKGHGGGGPAEDDNRNGIGDSDEQQKEEGGVADEEPGPQAAAAAESEPEDGAGAGDDSEESDEYSDSSGDDSEVAYEEHGHPVVAATGVTVPEGWAGPSEIEVRFSPGTTEATKQLGLGVIGRTTIDPRQVTDLIQQEGADPDVMPRLRKKGSKCRGCAHSLLCLAIDNLLDHAIPTIRANAERDWVFTGRPAVLPRWSSAGLQAAVMTALIDGGADINAIDPYTEIEDRPLGVAIASGNATAFELLMAQPGIGLQGHRVMWLRQPTSSLPPEYVDVLMSMYERLIREDPTLAAERDRGSNLMHIAAWRARGLYPKSFIDSYLDLITQHGAEMTAVCAGGTPPHDATDWGSPYVADYLCRKLPAEHIDRWNDSPHRLESSTFKRIIHSLLRAGADINQILTPTATEWRCRRRQLVLTEYPTVLNEVPVAVMSAVNAALAPAVGPQEAPIFGWRIASYVFDMDAAQEAVSEAIGVRHTDMARRVCAAAEHLVKSAVYQASSNRAVVGGCGGAADVGGQVVRVPQLQCFVVGGVGGRKMELREVVQRAVLDEAAKWGLTGAIDNGFSKDAASVEWGAVGWVERGRDGRQMFRSLQLT